MADRDNAISYVEFATPDLASTKAFFTRAFGWRFQDYGPDYTSFTGMEPNGGFYRGPARDGGALVVLYHRDLAGAKAKVMEAGGTISKEIFEFPGGKRFHFRDPNGVELAVWSEK